MNPILPVAVGLLLLGGRKRRSGAGAPGGAEPRPQGDTMHGTLLTADVIRQGTEDARTHVTQETAEIDGILNRWGSEIDAANLLTPRRVSAMMVWRESRGQADPAGGDTAIDERGIVQLSKAEAQEVGLPLEERLDPAKSLAALGKLTRKYVQILAPTVSDSDKAVVAQYVHGLGPGSTRDLLDAVATTEGESLRARILAWMASGKARATARQLRRVPPRRFVLRVVRPILRVESEAARG